MRLVDRYWLMFTAPVVVCLGVYDQIRKPDWIGKFVGCKRGGVDPAERVPVISGVSLSSQHLIEAVRRVMAVHQVMIARKIAYTTIGSG